MQAKRLWFARSFAPAAALFVAAMWLSLHHLAAGVERDYDEGVYWESLRSMHAGALAYRDVFVSQPPLFLATIHPFFETFGHSLFSARLGCAFFAWLGIAGTYLIGRSIAGTKGALLAVLLLVVSAPYLHMAQTLQAEAPAVGLSLIGTGAFFATRRATRRVRVAGALAAGACVGAALLCKLLVAAAVVPIAFGIARYRRRDAVEQSAAVLAGALAVWSIVGVAYGAELHDIWMQAVVLHRAAARPTAAAMLEHVRLIADFVRSPLTVAALAGTIVAIRSGDRSIVPIVAWLLATGAVLIALTPLFPHHLVVLVPPLAALAACAVKAPKPAPFAWAVLATCAALCALGTGVAIVRDARLATNVDARKVARVVADLRAATAPGDVVVADDQFVVALADRDEPPWLIDTSYARIAARQLGLRDFADGDRGPRHIAAVLAYSHRFDRIPGFGRWLAAGFRPYDAFGEGRMLGLRR